MDGCCHTSQKYDELWGSLTPEKAYENSITAGRGPLCIKNIEEEL